MSAPEFLFQQHGKRVRHFDLPGDAQRVLQADLDRLKRLLESGA